MFSIWAYTKYLDHNNIQERLSHFLKVTISWKSSYKSTSSSNLNNSVLWYDNLEIFYSISNYFHIISSFKSLQRKPSAKKIYALKNSPPKIRLSLKIFHRHLVGKYKLLCPRNIFFSEFTANLYEVFHFFVVSKISDIDIFLLYRRLFSFFPSFYENLRYTLSFPASLTCLINVTKTPGISVKCRSSIHRVLYVFILNLNHFLQHYNSVTKYIPGYSRISWTVQFLFRLLHHQLNHLFHSYLLQRINFSMKNFLSFRL